MDIKELRKQALNKNLEEKEKLVIEYFQSIALKKEEVERQYDNEIDSLNKMETQLYEEDFHFKKIEGMCSVDLIFNNK